jgi:hypothetical protein
MLSKNITNIAYSQNLSNLIPCILGMDTYMYFIQRILSTVKFHAVYAWEGAQMNLNIQNEILFFNSF